VSRRVAAMQVWWMRTFILLVLLAAVLGPPRPWPVVLLVLAFVSLGLSFVRPPRSTRAAVPVRSPLRGRWVALNSPASRVPSHGVRAYGQDFAVDVLHPTPEGVTPRVGWGLRGRRPEEYSCFAQPVHAVADERPGRAAR